MNIYFLDPQYVKDEVWNPLIRHLKVKCVYSFLPIDEIPSSLLHVVRYMLKGLYHDSVDERFFANGCVYWLRAHLESQVRLYINDYPSGEIPEDKRHEYSSNSALNNLRNLDDENVAILMRLSTSYDYNGYIQEPNCCVDYGQGYTNIPTHIASYCLNILHKRHQHYEYNKQSSFVMFDEFMSRTYRYNHSNRQWCRYTLKTKNGGIVDFISSVLRGVREQSPLLFPLILMEDGRKRYTLLRTENGQKKLDELIKDAENRVEENRREEAIREDDIDWQREVDELNRNFWKECGEAGSNCDSWPGWD